MKDEDFLVQDDDWRLKYYNGELNNCCFKHQKYSEYQPEKITKYSHEHCYFCWQRIGIRAVPGEIDADGWVTIDCPHTEWLCNECFHDLKNKLKFQEKQWPITKWNWTSEKGNPSGLPLWQNGRGRVISTCRRFVCQFIHFSFGIPVKPLSQTIRPSSRESAFGSVHPEREENRWSYAY